MKKAIISIFFILFLSLLSFGQDKAISINIPFDNEKMLSFDGINRIFKIKTNIDGIIVSVESTNKSNYIDTEVIIDGERMNIKSKNRVLPINEILVKDDGIWVRGGPKSVYTKGGDNYLHVFVDYSSDVLYEFDELKLIKLSEKSVTEIFKAIPSKFSAITYFKNISRVDYRFDGNTNRKFEYVKYNCKYNVSYYYMDDKITPDIEIFGENLYSCDVKKNVINYFILRSADGFLAELLFPLIFLADPFSP